MIGGQRMSYQDISFDFEDLSEEELEELLDYSEAESTKNDRYALACQVLANMLVKLNPETPCNIEIVDLTICKLLIDGDIEFTEQNHSLH